MITSSVVTCSDSSCKRLGLKVTAETEEGRAVEESRCLLKLLESAEVIPYEEYVRRKEKAQRQQGVLHWGPFSAVMQLHMHVAHACCACIRPLPLWVGCPQTRQLHHVLS